MESKINYTNHATTAKNEPHQPHGEQDARRNPYQPQRPDGMLDLPDRPRTGSPVPWLTSIHATNGPLGGSGD